MSQIRNAFQRVFDPKEPTSPHTVVYESKDYMKTGNEAKPETVLPHSIPAEEQKQVFKNVLEKVAAYKTIQKKDRTQKFSKRLVLGAHHDIQAACCAQTGIVYGLLMPAIPGYSLLVDSPFSNYKNCRGMVQQGASYLRKLDAQILSGILIIMAENNGDIFRYQPSDTAAQKNALLRTIDREVLIDALILIEQYINGNNCFYIPKFSLILDAQTAQEGLNSRMREWLKTVVDAIFKPDTESYEEACAVHPSPRPASMATTSKVKKEAIAVRKEFRDWKKDAKEDINELFTAKKISFKIKNFLMAVLNEDNIAAAASETISLLCLKLNQLEDTTASELADQVAYFHSKLAMPTADWDSEEPSFSSQRIGSSLDQEQAEGQDQPQAILSSSESPAGVEPQGSEPRPTGKLTLAERILLKRKLAEEAMQQETPNDF